jgi:plastocyanin domain-containing protein
VPAKVTFVRKTDETCAKEVVIKEYKINRKLPLNEPVTVEFTPLKGEFTFACGMDMIKGTLIVERGEAGRFRFNRPRATVIRLLACAVGLDRLAA